MTSEDSATGKSLTKSLWSAAVFFITVGVFLRLYHLDLQSLWGDELATWKECWQPSWSAFWQSYFSLEVTPPLYFVGEFLVARLWPADEFSLRLLSVLAGFLFMLTGGLFAYELSGRRRGAGWVAAALVATSYRAVLLSREARCYSLLMALSALAGWAWLRIDFSKKRFSESGAWTYIGVAWLLAITHYFGVLVLAAQAVTTVIAGTFGKEGGKPWRNVFLTYGLLGAAFLPIFLFLSIHHSEMAPHGEPPRLSEFFVATREFFGGSSVNSLFAFALTAFALFSVRGRQRVTRTAVLSWIVLVFLLAWTVAKWKPVYSTRYFMVTLPMILVLAAVGCAELSRFKRSWPTMLAMICFCLLGLHETILGRHYFSEPQNEQIREASAAAAQDLLAYPDAGLTVVQFSPFTTELYMRRFGAARDFQILTPTMAQLEHQESWPAAFHGSRHLLAMTFTYDDREFGPMYDEISKTMRVLRREDFHHVSTAVLEPMAP